MTEIAFFINARQDGGMRTGIDVDGETIWHHFVPGSEDADPALLWWVDVSCEGDLPNDPDGVRQWMLEYADLIRNALKQAAGDIEPVGFDVEMRPFWREYASGNVRVVVVASAVRRLQAREMGAVLQDLSNRWVELLQALEQPSEV